MNRPPDDLFTDGLSHLVMLAHQDDELPYAGTFSRLRDPHFVFVTNGDGLAHESPFDPPTYAALRTAESSRALAEIGASGGDLTFLGYSEIEIYAALADMSRTRVYNGPLPLIFEQIAASVRRELNERRPDVVWTLAWQGGHPEHDLVHIAVVRAVRELGLQNCRVVELPAYELLLVAFRFRPWMRRVRWRIALTPSELAAKSRMLELYPTQERVIRELRGAVELVGKLGRPIGRGFSIETFFAEEEFGPLHDHDYRRSTHFTALLDYPFDDYRGTPIRFANTLGRVGARWAG